MLRKPHERCLLTELEDGTGVVLNLETKFYHTLNATAVALWKALAQGASTEQDLASRLSEEFDVTAEAALTDVKSALAEFEREGFLLAPSSQSR